MILVGRDLSPFTRRVAISMTWLGIPCRRMQLSTATDAEEVRAFNPLGRVPALVLENGEVLIDSNAILDHIDETVGPERALIPANGAKRRHVLKLTAIAVGVMEKAVAAYYERTRRPPESRFAPWLQQLEDQVQAGLDALEKAFAPESPWLVLDKTTQADISAVCAFDFVTVALPHLLKDNPLPRLRALAERLGREPAFLQTYPKT